MSPFEKIRLLIMDLMVLLMLLFLGLLLLPSVVLTALTTCKLITFQYQWTTIVIHCIAQGIYLYSIYIIFS